MYTLQVKLRCKIADNQKWLNKNQLSWYVSSCLPHETYLCMIRKRPFNCCQKLHKCTNSSADVLQLPYTKVRTMPTYVQESQKWRYIHTYIHK